MDINKLTLDEIKSVFRMRLPCRYFGFSQFFGQTLLDYTQFGLIGHNGLDMPFNFGEKIVAACDGNVFLTQTDKENGGYGNTVYQTTPIFEAKGMKFYLKLVYGHLARIDVKTGQALTRGQFLGLGDSTGFSTGNHLHLTLKPYFLQPNKVFMADEGNGYAGAIDPLPFFEESLPSKPDGVLPVDIFYGKTRNWSSFLLEKKILWQLTHKRGLRPEQDFTSREIRGLAYGAWALEEIFGKSNVIAQTKTWHYRKKYN